MSSVGRSPAYRIAVDSFIEEICQSGILDNVSDDPAVEQPITVAGAIMVPTFDAYIQSRDPSQATGLHVNWPQQLSAPITAGIGCDGTPRGLSRPYLSTSRLGTPPMDMPLHIANQRREIGRTLGELAPEQWQTPSCCAGWTVLDVAAHLTYGWHYSTLNVNWQLLRAGGDIDKVSAHYLTELTKAGGSAIASEFEVNADYRFKPPGLGYAAPLNDLVIHRRDMFGPLGITYDTDPELLRLALDKAVAKGMFGMVNSHKKLTDLSFTATDLDWTHGTGPEIAGPALPLAHTMWGRPHSLDELHGDGVDTLRTRLTP